MDERINKVLRSTDSSGSDLFALDEVLAPAAGASYFEAQRIQFMGRLASLPQAGQSLAKNRTTFFTGQDRVLRGWGSRRNMIALRKAGNEKEIPPALWNPRESRPEPRAIDWNRGSPDAHGLPQMRNGKPRRNKVLQRLWDIARNCTPRQHQMGHSRPDLRCMRRFEQPGRAVLRKMRHSFWRGHERAAT